jgi:rubrerythrin
LADDRDERPQPKARVRAWRCPVCYHIEESIDRPDSCPHCDYTGALQTVLRG